MKRMNRLMRLPLLCVLLSLALATVAPATDAFYKNLANLSYTVPGSPPPTIDGKNFLRPAFDNEQTFNVNYSVFSPNVVFYEPMNMLFYTNNGTMTANTPITNIFFFITSTFGSGLQFDNQTTNILTPHLPSDTFYNPGTIRCNSFLDGNNIFAFGGFQFFILNSVGECIVSATNIISPGVIQLGVNSLIQLTGQNVDLTRSTLYMETLQNLFQGDSVGVSSVGAVGIDTNADWNPGIYLTSTTARSSYSPFPNIIDLTNSTPYIDIQNTGPSNVVIRAVFVQNNSPGVPYNVYFDGNVAALGFGAGSAHVEWIGSYVDPATGFTTPKHLYLTDDYLLGASTNVFVIGGVPDNFSFLTSDTPLLFGPAPSGLSVVFPDGTITNRYSYMNAQLVPQTTATNASGTNPSGALTNLPGRVQITANKHLNLALAQISGQNYLSLTATNQFDGNEGAQILSPFSDINLGVTNGFLSVSNLLQSALPNWSGSIQAWSTRWVAVDANGVTNDYRVMIVGSSQLIPLTAPQVQDLRLHATNSLVICDVMNVMRSLNIDANSLTLTTNGLGNGAGSLQGELNLLSGNILWPNSMPNLRWLTNNGAIHVGNAANFYGDNTSVTIIPGTPLTAAAGILSQTNGANVAANDTVTIGSKQYTFVSSVDRGATANQIVIGTTFGSSMSNLIAAINHAAGEGTKYATGTTSNQQATAGVLASNSFTVTAITGGTNGNSIATTAASTHLTWNGHTTLFGGVDFVAGTTNSTSVQGPYGAFINNGLLSDQGSAISATYFENSGIITNGAGSFSLQATTAVLTNGAIYAGGDVSIIASSLVASNVTLRADRSLTLTVTNLLTDSDATNGNFWSVGSVTGNNGMKLTILPPVGDLRYTSITNTAPASKNVINVWAGQDRGVSTAGYTNNEAVGRLILSTLGSAPGSLMTFTGTGAGTSNAIYVDYLELQNQATNRDNGGNVSALAINTNFVIYYAQAVINGSSVADKLNHKNNDRLRWVSAYAGNYSSTNLAYAGVTNTVNAALAQSLNIDSDQDGTPNGTDATPFFGPTNVNLTMMITNVPPLKVLLTWQTIPNATNIVFYTTNIASPWVVLTNFVTPPTLIPAFPPYSPITVTQLDSIYALPRYYQVKVCPNSVLYYGP